MSNGTMYGDLDWLLNASNGFVSIKLSFLLEMRMMALHMYCTKFTHMEFNWRHIISELTDDYYHFWWFLISIELYETATEMKHDVEVRLEDVGQTVFWSAFEKWWNWHWQCRIWTVKWLANFLWCQWKHR